LWSFRNCKRILDRAATANLMVGNPRAATRVGRSDMEVGTLGLRKNPSGIKGNHIHRVSVVGRVNNNLRVRSRKTRVIKPVVIKEMGS